MDKIKHSQVIPDLQRIIGCHGGQIPGPTIVVLGGLHGNEAAGVFAIRRVLKDLQSMGRPFRGKMVAIAGNLAALLKKCRYVDEDLNRMWTSERVASLRAADPKHDSVEERELRDILSVLDKLLTTTEKPLLFLDLHTTSSKGPCFAITQKTPVHIKLVRELNVPTIVGMDVLEGTLMKYVDGLGHTAIGFEGGQHEQKSSEHHIAAAVWSILASYGCIFPRDFPQVDQVRRDLDQATREFPKFLEIHYHHKIVPQDGFVMEPGFENFHQVGANQLLAQDRRGEIRAREQSRLILPLYQGQGNDGFFLARNISIPSTWS